MSNLYQVLERGYSMRVVKVEEVITDLELEVINDVSVDAEVKTLEINRCGLQFANFMIILSMSAFKLLVKMNGPILTL